MTSGFLLFTLLTIHIHLAVVAFVPTVIRNASYRQKKADEFTIHSDGEGMAGATFNKHILGDVLRALQPRYLAQVKESISGNLKSPATLDLDPLLIYIDSISDNALPSWEDLEKLLKSQQIPAEKSFRDRLKMGSEHSALAKIRKFSPSDNTFATFYKDAASWCPYCQKVWIALEEKQISYKVVVVDMNCYAGSSKPSDFLKVQPSGSLPCVVFNDGTKEFAIGESNDILAAIDEMKPTPKGNYLIPKENSEEMDYMKFLCDDGRKSLERRLFSEWMLYLTGKRKPVEYKERYEAMLYEVDSVLAKSPGNFFMGKDISMADIKFIPFIERQAATLLYFKGFQLRNESKWPNIVKWLREMEKRPSYGATKSDVYTHSRALPPQIGGECTFSPDNEFITTKNSVDAYCLPTSVKPDFEDLSWREPGWETEGKLHRREAAERILHNRENILKFASRAAGKPGFPVAAATLADPMAFGNDSARVAIDVFLRYTIHGLLQTGSRNKIGTSEDSLNEAAKALVRGGDGTALVIVDCLDYLRQRVGVPRDMSYPAAQQLRAELLHISTTIESESKALESSQVR